jgi:hypothetical protein
MKAAGLAGPWRAGVLALILGASIAAAVAEPARWPDTPAARDAANARIGALKRQLMSEPSATLVLARWCATYHLAPLPRIVALRLLGPPRPPPDAVRRNLALRQGEAVGYRRVQLLCDGRILSDAENWYVPDRLTSAMNESLDHTDTPFGLAARSLHFKRRTLSSETLWVFPAPGARGRSIAMPEHVLRNEGLLTIPGGLPISQVIENYTAAILGRPP